MYQPFQYMARICCYLLSIKLFFVFFCFAKLKMGINVCIYRKSMCSSFMRVPHFGVNYSIQFFCCFIFRHTYVQYHLSIYVCTYFCYHQTQSTFIIFSFLFNHIKWLSSNDAKPWKSSTKIAHFCIRLFLETHGKQTIFWIEYHITKQSYKFGGQLGYFTEFKIIGRFINKYLYSIDIQIMICVSTHPSVCDILRYVEY